MHQFRVEVLAKTPNPQQVIYAAMHQDYIDKFAYESRDSFPTESTSGKIIVKRLLAGERGHYGPLEHPQITFNCGYFPHSVMQQARTHRVGISFDCQSFRYTGQGLADLGNQINLELNSYENLTDCLLQTPKLIEAIEKVVYLRPANQYSDRNGSHYEYQDWQRFEDIVETARQLIRYSQKLRSGFSEEHARGQFVFDYRQHFVVSFNVRSFLHFCDLRSKKDAQLEIQKLCELMWVHFKDWTPDLAGWYEKQRLGRARLAP